MGPCLETGLLQMESGADEMLGGALIQHWCPFKKKGLWTQTQTQKDKAACGQRQRVE